MNKSEEREDVQILDSGNRWIKTLTNDANRTEDSWLHAIQYLSKAEYENEMQRGDPNDIYIVDGRYIRVGYRAEAYSNVLTGADRYNTPDYYRTIVGISSFNVYPRTRKNIVLFAGHAPQDISYRGSIVDSLTDTITVESRGKSKVFGYRDIQFWDEPIGGIMNVILTHSGRQIKGKNYARGASIVFDVGGYTVDVGVVEDNQVRTDELDSFTQVNLVKMERDFFYILRNDNRFKHMFVNAELQRIAPRIREALRTGVYDAGGYGELDVRDVVAEILLPMIRFVVQAYKNRGGTERFNNVFLTGGGAVTIEDVIRKALTKAGRVNGRGIYLAGDRVSPIFTNAYGASKLASFYSRKGRI